MDGDTLSVPNAENPPLPRLAASLDEVAAMLGIGRTLLAQMDRTGEFGPRFYQLGRRRVACVEEVRAWMRYGCPPRPTWGPMWEQLREVVS